MIYSYNVIHHSMDKYLLLDIVLVDKRLILFGKKRNDCFVGSVIVYDILSNQTWDIEHGKSSIQYDKLKFPVTYFFALGIFI